VGKSSLINSLLGSKLAVTSKTPGRTRGFNYYDISGKFYCVDLPGYGKAQVAKPVIDEFHAMIRDYCTLRSQSILLRTFVLIDARRGLTAPDVQLLDILDREAIRYVIVLTKVDLIRSAEIPIVVKDVHDCVEYRKKEPTAAYPTMYLTSSREGFGIPELRGEMWRLARDSWADRSTMKSHGMLPKGQVLGV
jgi:GTP-binding protein